MATYMRRICCHLGARSDATQDVSDQDAHIAGFILEAGRALVVAVNKWEAVDEHEREMTKRLAAIAMQRRIGEVFDAIVTGAKPHGTFVRALQAHAEGLLVQSTMQHTGFAFLHMELNVENPVFAGDTIHAECEVVEARRSKSRPDRGLVRTRIRVVKQDGTVALTYTPLRMVKCRERAT